MADNIVINGDLAGRDIINGSANSAMSVQDIIAAKLAAKKAEIEREAAEDAANGSNQGGVNFGPGCKITIGGKVFQKDNIA